MPRLSRRDIALLLLGGLIGAVVLFVVLRTAPEPEAPIALLVAGALIILAVAAGPDSLRNHRWLRLSAQPAATRSRSLALAAPVSALMLVQAYALSQGWRTLAIAAAVGYLLAAGVGLRVLTRQ